MGKRASTGSGRDTVAKAPRTSAATKPKLYAAELALLKQAELPESCHGMLEAMLPHVFATPEAERHEHQVTMAKTFDAIFTGLALEKRQDLDSATAVAAEARAGIAKLADELAAAEAALAAKRELAAVAGKRAEGETAERLAAGRAALQAAKEKQAGLGTELAKAEKDKQSAEELSSAAWEPVRSGLLSGKEKEQALRRLHQAFKAEGLQDSFLDALPQALKASAEERGDFAKAVIEFADAKLKAKMASCTDIISGFDAATAKSAADVTAAETELAAAKDAHGLVEDAQIEAENALLEVTESRDAAAEQKALGEEGAAEAEATVKRAMAALEMTEALLARVGKSGEPEAPAEADAREGDGDAVTEAA